MNKKFLSAILFGALMVTSTGTFVSCKDYDDDIEDLQGQINDLKSSLTTEVNALKSELAAAKTDLESKLSAAKTDLEKKIAANSGDDAAITKLQDDIKAINKKLEGIADLQKAIEDLGDELDDTSAANKEALAAIKGDLSKLQTQVESMLGKPLAGLVFVPNLYWGGVEAARYPYADGKYFDAVASEGETGKDDEKVAYEILKGAKSTYSNAKGAQYYMSSIDSIYYHVNPVNAKLDGVEWSFYSNDAELKARAVTAWTPVFKSAVKNNEILSVAYSIENPENLYTKDLLSIMSLNGELPNDSIVNSDYSAILPAVNVWSAIGLNDKELIAKDCKGGLADELYAKAADAIKNVATIPVQYNDGAINLDSYLNIHYFQNDLVKSTKGEELVMPYKTALENWGLKFVYELLPYTLGTNETAENAYGKIEDNLFYPCYVDSEGNSIKCATDGVSTTGISAVGKKPVVIVTLVDTNNDNEVVLSGYIKLQIVKEVKNDKIDLTPAFELPYICGPQTVSITWAQASDQIYEATKMSKEEFVKAYDATNKTYIYKDGEFVESEVYGTVTPNSDAAGTTNNILTWNGTKTEIDAINDDFDGEVTLYAKFESTTDIYNFYYIGITVKVLPKLEVTLGEKIEKYWFPVSKAVTERDSVRASVPAPDTKNNVTKYVKDMDDYFVGNEVKPFKTDAAQNAAYEISATGNAKFAYNHQFAENQPKVGDYQLYASTDFTKLLADDSTTEAIETDIVATINTKSGVVTYSKEPVAKALLNLYGHNDPQSVAANIEIVSTYGECLIPLQNDIFTVRFQRPVDFFEGNLAVFEDAQANGSSVTLGDLLGLKDWREVALIVWDEETKKYVSAKENGFALYPYYKFSTIKIDIANAMCDLNGKMQKVSEVTDKLALSVDGGSNTVNISDVNAFNTTKITYKNNAGNVQQFNLEIPVELNHAWGTLKGTIKAEVKSTKASAN